VLLHVLTFAPFALPGFLQAAQASPVLYLCAAISGVANGLYFLGLRARPTMPHRPARSISWCVALLC